MRRVGLVEAASAVALVVVAVVCACTPGPDGSGLGARASSDDGTPSPTSGGTGPSVTTTVGPGGATTGTTGPGGVTSAPTTGTSGASDTGSATTGATSSSAGDTRGSGDACADALFCDDFEDDAVGQVPGAPWVESTNAATVEISTERAFSGSNAVHVFADPDDNYRRGYFALQGDPVFPAAGAEMYGRVMVWLESTPQSAPGDPLVHWTIIQGEGRSADGTHNALYRYGGQQQGGAGLMANYETTDIDTDCWQHSGATMPTGTWTCLEWHFVRDTNEMQFWLDGTELGDLHVTGSGQGCGGDDLGGVWQAPAEFQSLYLGWERYQRPVNDRNLWIDDVAVSTSRVGCPAASP